MDEAAKKKLDEILLWIMHNSENEQAMNKIAYAAYPYTTKYKERYSDQNGGVEVHS